MTAPTTSANTTTSGGWFRVQDAAIARIGDIGTLALVVYVVLAKHADRDGWSWPSVATIARLCGSTERSVRRAIDTLSKASMIHVEASRSKSGATTANRYRILPLEPADTEAPGVHSCHGEGGSGVRGLLALSSGTGVTPEHHEPETQSTRPIEPDGEAAAPPAPDDELASWLIWWNDLKARGLVSAGVNTTHPSEDVQSGWKRVQKSKKLRDLLADRPAIEKAIVASDFIRDAGWFTLAALFGGKNKLKALYIERLLSGGYRDGNGTHKSSRVALVDAGQRHPDDRHRDGF
jgi:hypothetical protein